MDDIIRTIPKIKAEWEDVAFALRFKLPKVRISKLTSSITNTGFVCGYDKQIFH